MPRSIMVPVDLAHTDALDTAISVAGTIATADKAKVTIVGVTGSGWSEAARNPEEYDKKLTAFAQAVSQRIGLPVETRSLVDNDVSIDLGNVLIRTAEDLGVDLIVMASHVPGFIEHIFASNAGYVASHAKCSVYVVR